MVDRRRSRRNRSAAVLQAPLLGLPVAVQAVAAQQASAEVQELPGVVSARELLATSEWAAFRSFWRSMEPAAEGDLQDWDLVSARMDTLSSLVRDLRRASCDSTVEECVGLLATLCGDRLSMSAYGLPEMMTRMIPSRAVFHEETALRRLEGRLTAMRELSLDSVLDLAAMVELTGSAVKEATAVLLFDAMSDSRLLPHSFYVMDEESLSTMELLAFDLAALDSVAALSIETSDPYLKEACTMARGRIRSIQSSLPALEVLLGDLIAPR